MKKAPLEKYTGCILGGAVGDALGAPIEFMTLNEIKSEFGPNGVQDYVEFGNGTGEFTDDTQMTLFTAEGLLRSLNRFILKGIGGAMNTIVHHSYLRWLHTQGAQVNKENIKQGKYDIEDGWLIKQKELFKRRAPGNTCLSALSSGLAGTINNPINNSKGCGTIMRVAPVGLFYAHNSKTAFEVSCELSATTHGHPSGYLSAGFFAAVISDLTNGLRLSKAIENAVEILKTWNHHEETLLAVQKSMNLFEESRNKKVDGNFVEQLGAGWVAEEALAISLFCALKYENNFKSGVLLAINHSGDCDSTGSITGNILGLINGESSIPLNWIENLKNNQIVRDIAIDLHIRTKSNSHEADDEWFEKYPPY